MGARDGIFFWDFNGDVDADYAMPQLAGQDFPTVTTEREDKNKSML